MNVGYESGLAHEIEQLYRRRDLLLTNDLDDHIQTITSTSTASVTSVTMNALMNANQEKEDGDDDNDGEIGSNDGDYYDADDGSNNHDNANNDANDDGKMNSNENETNPLPNIKTIKKDQASVTTQYVEDTWKRRLFRIPKYFSVITFDLWWAAISKKWLKTIRKEIPDDFKQARPSRVLEVSLSSSKARTKSTDVGGVGDDDDSDDDDYMNRRVCCGLLKRSSYLLAPTTHATHEEETDYKKWKITRMPSYLKLLQDEAAELQMMTTRFFDFDCNCTIPLYLFAIPVFCGVGHLFTEIGRKYWFIVYLKFSRFLLLIGGCWTSNMIDSFDIETKMAQYSLHRRLRQQEQEEEQEQHTGDGENGDHNDSNNGGNEDGNNDDNGNGGNFSNEEENDPTFILKHNTKHDCSRLLYALIATRAVLIQMVPYGSILTVFASLTAGTPLFVRDKELNSALPPLLYSSRECLKESTKLENNIIDRMNIHRQQMHASVQTNIKKRYWLILLQAIRIFFLDSRLLVFFCNMLKYIVAMSLIFCNAQTSIDVLGLVSLLSTPFAIAGTFEIVILLGKEMRITDADLIYVFYPYTWQAADGDNNEDKENKEGKEGKESKEDVVMNPIQSRTSRVGALYSYYEKEEESITSTDFIPERLSVVSMDQTGLDTHTRRTTVEMRHMLRTNTLAGLDDNDNEL
jgi:hypothetical protein